MKTKLTAEEYLLIDPGYRRVYQPPAAVPAVEQKNARLSGLRRGQRVKPRRVQVQHHAPPLGLSEASLLRILRAVGVGRPATYAGIIDSLVQREYLRRTPESGLIPTERGREACAYLIQAYPQVFEPGFTAQMELRLDAIAAGEATYQDTIQTVWGQLQQEG